MSGKYIPPALRNKKANVEEPKKKVPTQDEFPSLGSVGVKTKASFKPIRSFASLATEWQEHEEEEKIRKEAREMIERREAERREIENRNVFVYRQAEFNGDDDEDEYDGHQSKPVAADDWTTIEKKARRELTTEELYEKKLRMEEEERRMAEDSVWNNGQDDEWDYRDRRAYS
jgi:hypothetical protein